MPSRSKDEGHYIEWKQVTKSSRSMQNLLKGHKPVKNKVGRKPSKNKADRIAEIKQALEKLV